MATGFHKSGQSFRKTFSDLLEQERAAAAERVWAKAMAVSSLRRCVSATGRYRQARMLGEIKVSLIRRSLELAPEKVSIGIDDDYHIGLLSIRWSGCGRLHLPAATDLKIPQHRERPLAMAG